MKTRFMLSALLTVGLLLGPLGQQAKAVTYAPVSCSYGYYADSWNAYAYLDMWPAPDDYGLCVPSSMFTARDGYLPFWGSEANVENDYGEIVIKQNGNCSPPALPTGLFLDFELPCKAHDYWYDLRKAGFSGTVSDNDCDGAFFYLMEAHCNDRFFCEQLPGHSGYLLLRRLTSRSGHRSDPAAVSIQALHSGQCADVPYSSTSFDVTYHRFVWRMGQKICFGKPTVEFPVANFVFRVPFIKITTPFGPSSMVTVAAGTCRTPAHHLEFN